MRKGGRISGGKVGGCYDGKAGEGDGGWMGLVIPGGRVIL